MTFMQSGDVLLRKMRTYIARLDADGDGYITKRDFELIGDRYVKFGTMDSEKMRQGAQQLMLVWYIILEPESVDGKVDPDKVITAYTKSGRDLFIGLASICLAFIFNVMDNGNKGHITKEEFRLFQKIINVENEQDSDAVFEILDINKDGELSFLEFIKAGLDFFLSNDENSPYNVLFGPLVD